MSLTVIFEESISQTVGGVCVGLLLDNLFPSPEGTINNGNFFKSAIEISAQLTLFGFLTKQFNDWNASRGLNPSADPVGRVIYTIVSFQNQPNLLYKISAMGEFLETSIKGFFEFNTAKGNQVSNTNNDLPPNQQIPSTTNQNETAFVTHDTPIVDDMHQTKFYESNSDIDQGIVPHVGEGY